MMLPWITGDATAGFLVCSHRRGRLVIAPLG
jgi:hypothetical protein